MKVYILFRQQTHTGADILVGVYNSRELAESREIANSRVVECLINGFDSSSIPQEIKDKIIVDAGFFVA